nr:hypothetical protein [Tanacetum cinerariifolium]
MVIDKSWTCLGRHEKEFYTGLKKFVKHCKLLENSSENVKCPCKSCRLVSWVSIRNLSDHITNYGWDPSYKTWIHHGELNLPSSVIDNTRQPQMSDMTTCLNDLSYIPPSNEQNEPTQRDIVNGVRFVVHSHHELHTTHNSDVCSPDDKDEEMYYGQLEEILEFSYMSFKVVLFRVKWFDTSNEGRKVKRFVIRNNMTQIQANDESFKDDQYILATQVKQVFYLEDMARRPPNWKVVKDVNHKNLNDLDFSTLHIDGQSIDVDAPPDIIDVEEDDDIIDEEDAIPHDLEDYDDEDLVNFDDDDDDVAVVYSSKEED